MNKKIKVLYIQHTGTYGGPCRSLGFNLKHLNEMGIEAHVMCPEGKAQDYFRKFTPHVYSIHHHGVSLIQTTINYPNTYFLFWRHQLSTFLNKNKVKKLIKEINPDLIHLNEFGLWPIAKVGKELGIPSVAHARTMPHTDFPRLNKYVYDSLDKYCNHVICISGSVANKIDVKNKSIIHNPVERIPEIKDLSANKGKIKFLSLSAVRKSKGILELMDAAKILKDDKRIKIIVAGQIDLNRAKVTFKQKVLSFLGLQDMKESLKILEKIKVFREEYDNIDFIGHVDDVDKLMATEIDVMLAPMRLNSPPRSIFEAGVHGIPSILSMEEKVEDIIEDNVNGFLIDEVAPKQLVEAMLKLVDDPQLRIEMGKKAREKFIVNHYAKNTAKKIYDVYNTILTK